MTSECFVYIVLPGACRFVTAGRFVLETDRAGGSVGRFVYGRRYLERPEAVPIDPLELKLGASTYRTAALGGVFGALRDAGPDYWGRRVIEKHAGKPMLGELDYLLYAPDDRAGALGFGLGREPPAPKREFNKTLHLGRLLELADSVIADASAAEEVEAGQVEDLMLVGTSMGGARPKAVVEDEEGLWNAKFNRPDDKWNHARTEHAMLLLARAARDTSIRTHDLRYIRRGRNQPAAVGLPSTSVTAPAPPDRTTMRACRSPARASLAASLRCSVDSASPPRGRRPPPARNGWGARSGSCCFAGPSSTAPGARGHHRSGPCRSDRRHLHRSGGGGRRPVG